MTDDVPQFPVETRQQQRLAALPAVYKTQYERLACELALKLDDPDVIFARHGYTAETALELLGTLEFQALLTRVEKEVRESGLSFRTKARAMAEDLLPYAHELATDELASGSVRADLIQWFARIADLEPEKKDGKGSIGAGGINLNITFAGQPPQSIVSHQPITIEAE